MLSKTKMDGEKTKNGGDESDCSSINKFNVQRFKIDGHCIDRSCAAADADKVGAVGSAKNSKRANPFTLQALASDALPLQTVGK